MDFLHYHLWLSPVLLLVMISLLSESSATTSDYLLLTNASSRQVLKIDNRVPERYLRLKSGKLCSFRLPKTYSLTYKLYDIYAAAYRLCGYFDDNIGIDCDTTIKMDYDLAFTAESYKTFTCKSNPHKYCSPIGHDLRITVTSKDYCKMMYMKINIQLEPLYSNIIQLNSQHNCLGSTMHEEGSGYISSQFDPDWSGSPSFCKIELRPPLTHGGKFKFCMQFITYLTGADLIVTVNGCVMKFGDNRQMTMVNVCQDWDKKSPVTVDVAGGHQSSYEHPLKHFYLFRYSFEEAGYQGHFSHFCEKKDEDDSDDGGLKPYQIALIFIGVIVFLIVFSLCCCKKKKRKQRRSDLHDINNAGGNQIIYPRQTIESPSPTPETAAPYLSTQEAPAQQEFIPVVPRQEPSAPGGEEPPDYYSLFSQGTDSSNM